MNRMSYLKRVDWAISFLDALRAEAGSRNPNDYPASPGNISFILHWMGRENTAAKNNPLATSWDMGNSES